MRKRSVAVRSALLTVRDLVGGLIAAVGLGALIAAGGKSFPRAAQVIAGPRGRSGAGQERAHLGQRRRSPRVGRLGSRFRVRRPV